jgi:hypothetical protein
LTDEMRIRALRDSTNALAKCVLSDLEPHNDDLGLLCLVLVDSALAGDRPMLTTVGDVARQLIRWLPAEGAWISSWLGRLEIIELVSRFLIFGLEQEYKAVDH